METHPSPQRGAPRRQRGLAGWCGLITALMLLWIGGAARLHGETAASVPGAAAILLEIKGPIGPAVDDYLERGLKEAHERGAPLVIIRMDTPGGLADSMRAVIGRILASPIPIAVYVSPEGARAASAGTYILYAAHVAAMAPATSVGAATPVRMGGGGMPGTEETDGEDTPGAMERKIISDSVSYIRGLAELRGRNAEWAEEAVRMGVSLTSSEALEKQVIDLLVADIPTLLREMDGRTVLVLRQEQVLSTRDLQVEEILPDWRTQFLATLTNPNVAFILMLVGIYGLIFELMNPGGLIPGIAGAICLLFALFSLHLLPINYTGLALIGLGIVLMGAEAFVPSFGALGIGGLIAFVLGAIILIDADAPGFELYLSVVLSFAVLSAVVLILVVSMALKSWRKPRVSGREGLLGSVATALHSFDTEGRVSVLGESWQALSHQPVTKGQQVKVTAINGLVLTVEPLAAGEAEFESLPTPS